MSGRSALLSASSIFHHDTGSATTVRQRVRRQHNNAQQTPPTLPYLDRSGDTGEVELGGVGLALAGAPGGVVEHGALGHARGDEEVGEAGAEAVKGERIGAARVQLVARRVGGGRVERRGDVVEEPTVVVVHNEERSLIPRRPRAQRFVYRLQELLAKGNIVAWVVVVGARPAVARDDPGELGERAVGRLREEAGAVGRVEGVGAALEVLEEAGHVDVPRYAPLFDCAVVVDGEAAGGVREGVRRGVRRGA